MAIWLKKKNQKHCCKSESVWTDQFQTFECFDQDLKVTSVMFSRPAGASLALCPRPKRWRRREAEMRGDIDIPAVEYHILQPHSSSPGVSSDHRSPGTNLPWHRVSTLGHRIGSPRCPVCSHQPHPRTRNPKKWRLLLSVPQLAVNVKTSISFSPTWFVKPFFFLFGLQYLVFSAGGSQTTPTLLPGVKAYQ